MTRERAIDEAVRKILPFTTWCIQRGRGNPAGPFGRAYGMDGLINECRRDEIISALPKIRAEFRRIMAEAA